ncbi:MAG: hypothetical protein IJ463_00235 [Bacilli bacterium]|nr:hypothetical protein [Bacilli bacterium]
MALLDRYIGRYVKAESASNYIDAKGIIKYANTIKTNMEDFSLLSNDVKSAGSELTPSTLFVDGEDFSDDVEELGNDIASVNTNIIGDLDSVIAAAENAYNKKQEELNSIARARDIAEANRRAAMNSRSN